MTIIITVLIIVVSHISCIGKDEGLTFYTKRRIWYPACYKDGDWGQYSTEGTTLSFVVCTKDCNNCNGETKSIDVSSDKTIFQQSLTAGISNFNDGGTNMNIKYLSAGTVPTSLTAGEVAVIKFAKGDCDRDDVTGIDWVKYDQNGNIDLDNCVDGVGSSTKYVCVDSWVWEQTFSATGCSVDDLTDDVRIDCAGNDGTRCGPFDFTGAPEGIEVEEYTHVFRSEKYNPSGDADDVCNRAEVDDTTNVFDEVRCSPTCTENCVENQPITYVMDGDVVDIRDNKFEGFFGALSYSPIDLADGDVAYAIFKDEGLTELVTVEYFKQVYDLLNDVCDPLGRKLICQDNYLRVQTYQDVTCAGTPDAALAELNGADDYYEYYCNEFALSEETGGPDGPGPDPEPGPNNAAAVVGKVFGGIFGVLGGLCVIGLMIATCVVIVILVIYGLRTTGALEKLKDLSLKKESGEGGDDTEFDDVEKIVDGDDDAPPPPPMGDDGDDNEDEFAKQYREQEMEFQRKSQKVPPPADDSYYGEDDGGGYDPNDGDGGENYDESDEEGGGEYDADEEDYPVKVDHDDDEGGYDDEGYDEEY